MKKADGWLAASLAGVSLAAGWIWRLTGVVPSCWDDLAAAGALRPATHMTGSLAAALTSVLGLSPWALSVLGNVVQALSVACVYALARLLPVCLMRSRPQSADRRGTVQRISAAFAALCFALSEPVWLAGQCFGEATLLLFLELAASVLFLSFLLDRRPWRVYPLVGLVGALSAEGPAGLVLFVLFGGLLLAEVLAARNRPVVSLAKGIGTILVERRWQLTIVLAGAWLTVFLADAWHYSASGALEGCEHPVGEVLKAAVLEFCHAVQTAGGPAALAVWAGFLAMPFVVTVLCYPRAADEDRSLSYVTGVVCAGCALVSVCQFGSLPGLWFWTYVPVRSEILLLSGLALGALTLQMSVSVIGVEAVCRDLRELFGRGRDEEPEADGGRAGFPYRRLMTAVLVLGLVFVLVPGRARRVTVRMSGIVTRAVEELVAECEGARHLFTDVRLDAAIELEAARRGAPILCHSLLGGSSRNDINLRARGTEGDAEDRRAFSFDAAMGLRLWMRDKSERMREAACLLGFDLWNRSGLALPPFGGFVSRPSGWQDPSVRAPGLEAARGLAEEILDVYGKGGIGGCACRPLRDAFEAVQWRLARMAFYRSEVAELKGEAEAVLSEQSLTKRLNACNATYQRALAQAVRTSEQLQKVPTSREGLMQSLLTADFTRAKVFADIVLASDPDEVHANFASAMFYVKRRQFTQAEIHLKRCLQKSPKDAALYNNLAMVQAELGKFDEALDSVGRAAVLLPESAEIAQTRKFILERQKSAAK